MVGRTGRKIPITPNMMKDLVRNGLVNVPERADSLFENMARRMVDAQAQGLAGRLRAIEEINFLGEEWKYELTDRLGKLYTPEMRLFWNLE